MSTLWRHPLLLGVVGGLVASGVTRLPSLALRLPRRSKHGDEEDYPAGPFRVEGLDATHMGPVVAVLTDRLTGESRADLDIEQWAKENFTYEEIARSAIEVALSLAMEAGAAACLDGGLLPEDCTCGGDDECDEVDDHFGVITESAVAVLEHTAEMYEAEYRAHAPSCRSCQSAGGDSPALVRAILCHDLALGVDEHLADSVTEFSAVPPSALFDVAYSLLLTAAEARGVDPSEQIRDLAYAVVEETC